MKTTASDQIKKEIIDKLDRYLAEVFEKIAKAIRDHEERINAIELEQGK